MSVVKLPTSFTPLLLNHYPDSTSIHSQIHRAESGFAGCSIISEEWILTAAHVFSELYLKHLLTQNWENTFLIAVGKNTVGIVNLLLLSCDGAPTIFVENIRESL